MNLTRLAVERPLTVLMAILGIVLMGGVAYTRLSVDRLPPIEIPFLGINVNYPQASAQDVEQLVAQPIENAVKTNKYVSQAVVVGDTRKFPSILVVPNWDALEKWAGRHNIIWTERRQLLERFPAHPAALAAALDDMEAWLGTPSAQVAVFGRVVAFDGQGQGFDGAEVQGAEFLDLLALLQ